MLYLIHGTDEMRGRAKLHALLEGLFLKRPDAEYFHVTPETWSDYNLYELASAQGLFEQKHIVVLDKVFELEEAEEATVPSLEVLHTAPHPFIFLEGALSKKTVSAFEKHSEKIYIFEKKKKGTFNMFSLADALGERNRKKLWTLYQKAKHENVSDEDIQRILFWQVKGMLFAKSSKNAEEAGMKPFPFSKSRGFLKNYTDPELTGLSRNLVAITHDAHRGAHELGIALERFILGI